MASQGTLRELQHCSTVNRDLERPALASIEEQLLALQWAQLKHDELCHRDILLLPVADRMKHFALHMAKYVGYVAEAIDTSDEQRLERTLVDAFIISLASANTLGLDLGDALARPHRARVEGLKALGLELANELGQREGDSIWLLKQFARHSGRLAKACESLDHVESYPFREEMRASIVNLFKLVAAAASLRHIDLVEKSKGRLEGIEGKNIFHENYRARLPE
jgi:hypothetical protein